MPVYCASAVASVALKAERFGYRLHGHDVELTVCIDLTKPYVELDLTALSRAVADEVAKFSHAPLWERLCIEDPLIEHLAAAVLSKVIERLQKEAGIYIDMSRARVEARVPEGKIIVSGAEAERIAGGVVECS